MEFYFITYQPQFTYILQAETVFPLKDALTQSKVTPKPIYKAAKPQSRGFFPGSVRRAHFPC